MTSWTDAPAGDKNRNYLQTFDTRTGKISAVPDSQGMVGAQYITQDTLVAAMTIRRTPTTGGTLGLPHGPVGLFGHGVD